MACKWSNRRLWNLHTQLLHFKAKNRKRCHLIKTKFSILTRSMLWHYQSKLRLLHPENTRISVNGSLSSINQSINEIYIAPWSKTKFVLRRFTKRHKKYNNTHESKDEIQLLAIHKFKQMVFQESFEDVYWSAHLICSGNCFQILGP